MYIIYRILTVVLSPFVWVLFHLRCLYGKDNVREIKNHFGIPTRERNFGNLIWIHAVSVGESTSALTYIEHLKKKFPNLNILITTTTVTAAKNIATRVEKIRNCVHQFVVADNPFWITRFLNYWHPKIAIFMESEIWPNLLYELDARQIPIFLLNARFSRRAFNRWKFCKGFLSEILKKFQCIMAQSKIDEERFMFFSKNNVKRVPNLKLVNPLLPYDKELAKKFKQLCSGKKIFVAASTHENEEAQIIAAHKNLKQNFDIITIIVPRHIDRIPAICEILKKQRIKFSLRSKIDTITNSDDLGDVCCVDSFGEVGTFYRLADICFVGGTLVPVGGHNIYEPVALKKPVLFGPYLENVLEMSEFLISNGVAFLAENSISIYSMCKKLLSNPQLLKDIAKKATLINRNNPLVQIDDTINLEKVLSEEKLFK